MRKEIYMNSAIKKAAIIQTLSPRQWIKLILVYAIFLIILLTLGNDFLWWQAWIYSLLVFSAGIGGRWWAEARHPGILVERTSFIGSANVKSWDKILAPLMALSIAYPLVIVAALDHHYGWSANFPTWLTVAGLFLVFIGYAFATWALAENRFFAGVVRIQTERGHTVCDTGPYRIVRHPGYAGNALALPGMVLALSSVWTLIPAAFALIIIILRTLMEDKTLQAELPGYREYAQRVRFRLFPGIY